MRGIRRCPVNSPHKVPVTRKMFPLVTSSCNIFGITITNGDIVILTKTNSVNLANRTNNTFILYIRRFTEFLLNTDLADCEIYIYDITDETLIYWPSGAFFCIVEHGISQWEKIVCMQRFLSLAKILVGQRYKKLTQIKFTCGIQTLILCFMPDV